MQEAYGRAQEALEQLRSARQALLNYPGSPRLDGDEAAQEWPQVQATWERALEEFTAANRHLGEVLHAQGQRLGCMTSHERSSNEAPSGTGQTGDPPGWEEVVSV